jgi:uncharacterized protein YprB with RNaseH-like and TPR domain
LLNIDIQKTRELFNLEPNTMIDIIDARKILNYYQLINVKINTIPAICNVDDICLIKNHYYICRFDRKITEKIKTIDEYNSETLVFYDIETYFKSYKTALVCFSIGTDTKENDKKWFSCSSHYQFFNLMNENVNTNRIYLVSYNGSRFDYVKLLDDMREEGFLKKKILEILYIIKKVYIIFHLLMEIKYIIHLIYIICLLVV